MAITQTNIKLMASQDLSDREDAGGRMTGNEIVDGNVNNLFPDISRLDRVYGRVSMRKAFLFCDTEDNDTYFGSHLALTDPPDDPLVKTVMFTTDSPTDQRAAAKDRVESYVAQSSAYPGGLLGNQLSGQRAIQIYQRTTTSTLPKTGDVLYLADESNYQYVRITDVETETRELYDSGDGADFTAVVVTLGISDPLRYQFDGSEDKSFGQAAEASIYTTQIADSAMYYGVATLAEAIESGDLNFKVDTIFQNLVPSAQVESALVDLLPGANITPAIAAGSGTVSLSTSADFQSGLILYPGPFTAITITANGQTWTSQGNDLVRNDVVEGRCDGPAGEVHLLDVPDYGTQTVNMSVSPAGPPVQLSKTDSVLIEIANRAYNFTRTLNPHPSPGSIIVDYMSQGNWYRLRDNGNGGLVPDDEGTGTGIINYETGSVILTCAALPDVDSRIIYYWGIEQDTQNYDTQTAEADIDETDPLTVEYTIGVDDRPIEPISVSIEWTVSGTGTLTITDDGAGQLSGDGTGTIDYATGQISFVPDTLATDDEYALAWNSVEDTPVTGEEVNMATTTLANGLVVAGTAKFNLHYTCSIVDVDITAYDDGAGNIIATKRSFGAGYMARVDVGIGTTVGSINYTTGALTLSDIGGTKRGLKTQITCDGNGCHEQYVTGEETGLTLTADECTVNYVYQDAGTTTAKTATIETPAYKVNFWPVNAKTVIEGSVDFAFNGHRYRDRQGTIYKDISPITNSGTAVGSIDYTTGTITFDSGFDVYGMNQVSIAGLLNEINTESLLHATFRTPGAPVRPGSFYIQGNKIEDDALVSATADLDGNIESDFIHGTINVEQGIVFLRFGEWVTAAGNESESWYNADNIVEGEILKPVPIKSSTITYNCVTYSYLPLDADLIGLDPVRLPQDGRVPVFRKGDIAVVHNTQTETMPDSLVAGQTVTLSRDDLSVIELFDAEGVWVPSAGNYTVNLSAGTVTMSDPLDLSGFTQPLQARHRREDMILLGDVQINGTMSAIAQINHDYPADTSYVSSVLAFGDLQSDVNHEFSQATWTSVYSDERIGSNTTAQYNLTQYPIATTNKGAIRERWAIIFTSSTTFQVAGETTGIIATGDTSTDMAPVNPATSTPYFTIEHEGWGIGWSSGNCLRFNTDAAHAPVWVVRTTLQGPETETEDHFTLQLRGDAD